jgi:hypothetical protein
MNGNVTPFVTGRTLFLEWTTGASCCRKMNGFTDSKRNGNAIGTANYVLFPVKGKSGFGKSPLAIANRPRLAINGAFLRTVTHQFTGQVSPVNV